MEGSPPATIRAVSSAQWSLVVTTTKAEEFELGLVTSRQCFSLQSIFLIYRNFPEQLPTTFLCSPDMPPTGWCSSRSAERTVLGSAGPADVAGAAGIFLQTPEVGELEIALLRPVLAAFIIGS